MPDDQNADSKISSTEDHGRKMSSNSKSTGEEDSGTKNNDSVESFGKKNDTDWFSLTSFNTELSSAFEPYPFGSDGAMMYEDLRARLREIPRSIIDYMGYVPNSVIRRIIGKWIHKYRELIDRRRELVETGRQCSAEEMTRRGREFGRKKLTIEEDVSIGSGEFTVVSKKDAQRLKKIRMETTQQILTQSVRLAASPTPLPPESATTYDHEEITNESINLEEEEEEEARFEVAGERKPQVLSRYEMDQIIAQISEAIGGDDRDIGKLISGVLRGKASAVNTLASIIPDQDIRADFLHTILEPSYIIFLLNCHFQLLQAILDAINILLYHDPASSDERTALSEKFLEILGESPDSEDSRLMIFVQALEKTCDLVVKELGKRVLIGSDITDLKSQFKECLYRDDRQMINFASKVNISPIQLNDIIAMTLTCQYEALEEYLEQLPQPGKSAFETLDEEDEEMTGVEESVTQLTEKSPQDRQEMEKLQRLISEVISESLKDSEMESQEKELIEEDFKKAIEDENKCADLISKLRDKDEYESSKSVLKQIEDFLRNEDGTMDINALARIYNELQRTALDLQFELDELSEESEERQRIEDILKAIHEITKSLAGVVSESQSQDEDFSAEEVSFRDSVLKRLDDMIRRQDESRKSWTAAADGIQEYESSNFEEAFSSFETLSLPQSRIFDEPPLKQTSGKKSKSTTGEDEFENEVFSSATVRRSASQRFFETQGSGSIFSERTSIQPLSKSAESESSRTVFSLRYLEKSSTTSLDSFDLRNVSIEELAAYVMNEVLTRVKNFKEIEPKRGVKLHGEDGSKILRRKYVSETSGVSREDHWRRKKTRVLIEEMQDSLRESVNVHSLTPGEIREALANSDFDEVADEFKDIYGKQIIRSDDNSRLRKITCQMDTVSSKIGESLAIDKMMNLLSVLKAEDRKCAANEQLSEYFHELDLESMTYLEAMLTAVKENLLAEFAILSALSPPQRIAWMSIPENYENHHICLSILGQILQLQIVLPELNSIVSSTMVMNSFDAVAIFNTGDLLPISVDKNFCGYLRDEIEALSWFNVHIPTLDEILRQMTEDYDDECMGLLGTENSGMSLKPSIDKSLLDLVVSTGYTYVLHTGIGKEFSYPRADKQMGRTSAVDYISDLRGKTLESQPPTQVFETELEEIKRTAFILETAETLADALMKMNKCEPAENIFATYYQVATDEHLPDAKEIFKLITNSPYMQRKANLEKLLFAKITDQEILRDLEETRHLICKRILSRRFPTATIKQVKTVKEIDQPDRKSDIKQKQTNLDLMYLIRDEKQQKTTRVHFSNFYEKERKRRTQIKNLSLEENYYQNPPRSDLARVPSKSSEGCGKLRVALHDYPLNKEEIKAIEDHLKVYKNNKEQSTSESERDDCLPLEKPATDLNEKIVETLTKNPEAIHVLKRNPGILLRELRLKLKPRELTQVLTDVVRKTGGKYSKKIFLQALQSAIIAVNETKQFTKKTTKQRLRGRIIKRPSEIPSRDWQRLAQTDTAEFEPLPAVDGKRAHCMAEYISRLGYANIIGSTRAYLTRLDILQHLHKADHLRANEHIHNSIEECKLAVLSSRMLEYAKKLEAYMKSGSRHPVYPWTVASRIRQFPYAWYYQNNTFFRYYVLSMPVFLPLGVYLLYKAHFIKKKLIHNYDPFDPNDIPVQKIGHH